jgi:hypothetical protein
MTKTFAQLEALARKAPYAVQAVLSDAAANATDTVFVEKAAPEAEWDALALASIVFTAAYTEDRKVQAWFKRHGVEG